MKKDESFLFPMLYTGPKESKRVELGQGKEATFTKADAYPFPVADVTEEEGRRLLKRNPDLFRWADGIDPARVKESDEALEAMQEQIAQLTARIEALESGGKVTAMAKRGRKPAEAGVV
jgi:hypothetical protein